jgi:predicted ABC-class ATPase
VVGGSGDYFDVADHVIAMRDYQSLEDLTSEAKRVASPGNTPHDAATRAARGAPSTARVPLPSIPSTPAAVGATWTSRPAARTASCSASAEVELSAVEQLVEPAQARAIASAIAAARGNAIDGANTVQDVVRIITARLDAEGLDAFQPHPAGELAAFRAFELAAFLGRIRGLQCTPAPD